MKNLTRIFLFSLLTCVITLVAQAQSVATNGQASSADQKSAGSETRIPSGSKVFVAPMEGFETYMIAALAKKKVPLMVVAKREDADFEIVGSNETQKVGWAKIIFGSGLPSVEASIQVINLKTNVVACAIAESRRDATFGKRSVAEYLAKKIGQKMRDDEKTVMKQ